MTNPLDLKSAVSDPRRLRTLESTGLLDAPAEPAFDRLTRLAARLLGAPTAFFSLVDETRDFYVSACGIGSALDGARELTGTTFCHYAIQGRVPLVIPDTRADPVYREIQTVTSLGVASYIGVPVIVDGQAIGSFCVIDTAPRAWTADQIDTLVELAASAEREIGLRTAVVSAERLSSALDAERRRLADVFAQAPSFLAVLRGPDNVFEMVNAAYERIIGHGRDVIGKPMFAALPETRGQGFEESLAQVRTTGEPLVFRDLPVMLKRERGAPLDQRFLDVTYLPLVEADGTHEAVITHGTDVTEHVLARREVERLLTQSTHSARQLARSDAAARRALDELEATYQTAPVGLAVLDTDLRFRRVNAHLAEINGPTVEEHVGRSIRELLPALADAVEPLLQRVLDTGVAAFNVPVSGETPAAPGVVRHWVEQWLPLRDRDGSVTGISVVAEEVTDRHHAEAERERMLRETMFAYAQADEARRAAEAANRAKAEFLTVMSHELRTPLNAIDGYAELMELGIRGPVTDEQRHDLGRVRRSQKHLLGLINGVLNYARLEAGTVQYDLEDVILEEVLATCEALTSPQVQHNGLSLHRERGDPSLRVRADREKLQQVVLNLLSNAIKFTNAGGAITLRCDLAELDGDYASDRDREHMVMIRVADTGIGIAPHQLNRVFEPFVQVDTELTRTRDGTGLGLAISSDLARGMGGDLTATSVLGTGSTFTLSLPQIRG